MSIWIMLVRELTHRWLNTLISLAGVAGASGLLAGVLTSLDIHTMQSEAIVRRHLAKTHSELEELRTEVRGAMHHLGYNAIVLPREQSLGDWYADDYASKLMPESHGGRLAVTKGLADRYLPRLRRKIKWPETNFTAIIVGVGEEVVLDTSTGSDAPLVDPIQGGHCVVGYELHQALDLEPGKTITISGSEFIIERCAEELGTKDDITLWLTLMDAQQLLGQPKQINEILMVEHLDVWGRLAQVRRRTAAVLPDCQVVEMASETMSRAHARVKVAEEAEAAVEQERQRQASLAHERYRSVATFFPLCALVAAIWVAILMYLNVTDRAQEIGVLIAQGFGPRAVQSLFVSKAVLLGLFGGITGYICGAGGATFGTT